MKIVYQDLLRFFSEKPSKEDLSEKLYRLGHEHEIYGDIFDFEITPNRGDCLSLNGMARELVHFFGENKSIPINNDNIEEFEFDFENRSLKDCPKISFLEIEIEDSISEYSSYFENFFSILGNKKINFFTDISNYLSYELGQPTHCYDKDKLNGKLVFEKINRNEKFLSLLGTEIELTNENCVFTIDNKVENLAGIMGGEGTACSKKTRKVIIECAYFNPESIIGKSIKYNLISDAAHKFERGVDISSHEKVLRRFIKIIEDHAKIKTKKINYFYEEKLENAFLEIDVEKINSILGIKIKEDEYLKYLADLGFGISDVISIPSYRHDIASQNDLAEEVARIIGYNNIPNQPIQIQPDSFNKSETSKVVMLQSYLCEKGFNEVINFPFTGGGGESSIVIDNPLDSNKKNLRISLKESLIQNLLYNERRQKNSIKFFEISNIYAKENEINQHRSLGLIISGRQGDNPKNFSRKLDLLYFKNILKELIPNPSLYIEEIPRTSLDTKKKDKIFFVEVNIDQISDEFFTNSKIASNSINFIKYDPISEYPSIIRDFSFLIEDISKVGEVIKMLERISDNDIKQSFIFDFYEDKNNKNLKLGFRIVFQSKEKTLSEKEINIKLEDILRPIISLQEVSIPGF